MPTSDSRWLSIADRPNSIAWLIAGFTAVRLVLAALVPLLPQEAYYWSWSRHLDWSYFDHPPLASYSIALSTAVFGQTAFGIKSAAVLWALVWNLLWARLITDMYGDRRLTFWSLAALNLTLVYEVYAVGPTPDSPLLAMWTGAIWAVWRATQSGESRWWWWAGLFTGLSWLGKYSGVLLLPAVFLYLLCSPAQRHWLRRPQPYMAALIAVLVFAPVLYWNSQNDWVSLAFQSSRRVGDMAGGFHPRHFVTLAATQLLMLTPYLFVIALAALARGVRQAVARTLGERELLLLASALVPLLVFGLASFRTLAKINWLAPAWWSLLILATHHLLAREDGWQRLRRGLASSLAILLLAAGLLSVPNLPVAGDLNSWSGWRDAAVRVHQVMVQARSEGREVFVFAPNYKISSLMRFYLPGQPRTYAQDIYGHAALQFDHFPLESRMVGATGILVLSDQDQSALDLDVVRPYFASVEKVQSLEASAFGKKTRRIEIYRCLGYKGHPRGTLARGEQPEGA